MSRHCKKSRCYCRDPIETNLEEYKRTHKAEAIVLGCIDYRFVDTMITYLESGDLSEKYDLTAVAGASLGYNQHKHPSWTQTIKDQIGLAIELHHINQVLVFDHMDCGAYAVFYPGLKADSEEERFLHIKNIKKFIHSAQLIFPDLTYSGYLINTDNSIDQIV
jgi:carbonic anhydrase